MGIQGLGQISIDEVPVEINSVSDLRGLQNRKIPEGTIGEDICAALTESQSQFCRKSVREGIEKWDDAMKRIQLARSIPERSGPMDFVDEVLPERLDAFSVIAARLETISAELLTFACGDAKGFTFESITSEILDSYNELHMFSTAELSDREKLFLELAAGLRMYHALLETFRVSLPEILPLCLKSRTSTAGDFTTLPIPSPRNFAFNHTFSSTVPYLSALQEYILSTVHLALGSRDDIDSLLLGFAHAEAKYPDITAARLNATTMRTIPTDHPEFATFAQMMHWSGFGGAGTLYDGTSLAPLSKFAMHALSPEYDGTFSAYYCGAFVSRIREFASSAVARLLSILCKGQACIFEDGCGMGIPFASAIVSTLREGSGPSLPNDELASNLSFTFSDMSGASLAGVRPKASGIGVQVDAVLFRDLLTDQSHSGEISVQLSNCYDAYLVFFVWHQTTDFQNLEYLRRDFQFALNVVRPGGFISVSEPNRENVNMELAIDMVDRQGHLPSECFAPSSGLRLEEVMVPVSGDYPDLWKIPFRLSEFSRGFGPDELSPLFSTQSFLVVALSISQVRLLQSAIDRDDQAGCLNLVSSASSVPLDRLTSSVEA